MKSFPMGGHTVVAATTRAGTCAGVAQWIRLELDEHTRYENRPASHCDAWDQGKPGLSSHHACGWTHVIYRFPKLVFVEPGDILKLVVTHDRRHFAVELAK
jgi:hypothetical protein